MTSYTKFIEGGPCPLNWHTLRRKHVFDFLLRWLSLDLEGGSQVARYSFRSSLVRFLNRRLHGVFTTDSPCFLKIIC